jgi:hypothetical protein
MKGFDVKVPQSSGSNHPVIAVFLIQKCWVENGPMFYVHLIQLDSIPRVIAILRERRWRAKNENT